MKYLQDAIKFLIKNWILAVPLFVLTALAALLTRNSAGAAESMNDLWRAFSDVENFTSPGKMLSSLPAALQAVAIGGGLWAFLFNFIAVPTTYGLINKSLSSGNASLNDIGASISQNFVKYVMYFIGMIVLGVAVAIGAVTVILIFVLIASLIHILAFLVAIVLLLLAIATIILMVLLSMWLSSMVVDGLDVVAAAKKSIEIVRTCFWTVVGITLLVAIACGIAGWILGFLRVIPLLGPIIASLAPTVQTFVMMVFLLLIYRERTEKLNNI